MSLPGDSFTPLVLRSELRARSNIKDATDTNSRLLEIIIQASQAFQAACGRRFDEYLETRRYTPTHLSVGGDLLGLRSLLLDADLKSYSLITNGDGSTIDAGNVTLEPMNSAYHQVIRLNPYGIQFWYHAGVSDPHGSIYVTGTWGYGGGWINTTVTVATMTDSATSFTASATLEAGMVLKIDSEYLYVTAVNGTTITVDRAYNGSIAAAHTNKPIYRWKPIPTAVACVVRLIMLALEQDKSPLFGQTIIGDVVFPTTVDSYPKDVLAAIRNGGLVFPERLQSV